MKIVIKKMLIKIKLYDVIKHIILKINNTEHLRKKRLIKSYASNGIENIQLFDLNVNENEILKRYNLLFNLLNPKNINNNTFDYYLDTSIAIYSKKRIIDNIPVDYSRVLNCSLETLKQENIELISIIEKYANKCNINQICNAKDLKEALQIILFWNSILWQTGHKLNGLGRLDKILDKYDIPNDAELLITDFLLALHANYEYKSNDMLGDTGQIVVLGGLEESGVYFNNEYTYLFIKCLRKINLPDPKLLLRCSHKMPMDLLKEAVNCVSTGIGSPLFSNDDVIINKLIDFGYEKKDAYNYGVSACWEPLSIGNSLEQNNLANIEYGKCLYETIVDERFCDISKLDDVISIYNEKLSNNCQNIKIALDSFEWQEDAVLTYMMNLNEDISKGSLKYNNYGILSVGISSAVNSLLNIQKFVFEEKKYSLKQIQEMIINNNVDFFSKNDNGFGTDSKEAISLTNLLINETEKNFCKYRNKFDGKVKFGLSSPHYITISKNVGATLDGRRTGEPFQTHISRDKGEALTEIINFESKLNFTGISSNANVVDIMVQPNLIKDNIEKFAAFILGGIKQGFFQLQMNVLSYKQLVDAKMHPEKYPNLIVRVWGFSAYFNDLPDEYKDNLIKRAKEMENIF